MYGDARNQFDERMGAMGVTGSAAAGPSGSYAAGIGRQEAQIASDKWQNLIPYKSMEYQAQNRALEFGANALNTSNQFNAGNQNQANRDIWGANVDQNRYLSTYNNDFANKQWDSQLQVNRDTGMQQNEWASKGMGDTVVDPGSEGIAGDLIGLIPPLLMNTPAVKEILAKAVTMGKEGYAYVKDAISGFITPETPGNPFDLSGLPLEGADVPGGNPFDLSGLPNQSGTPPGGNPYDMSGLPPVMPGMPEAATSLANVGGTFATHGALQTGAPLASSPFIGVMPAVAATIAYNKIADVRMSRGESEIIEDAQAHDLKNAMTNSALGGVDRGIQQYAESNLSPNQMRVLIEGLEGGQYNELLSSGRSSMLIGSRVNEQSASNMRAIIDTIKQNVPETGAGTEYYTAENITNRSKYGPSGTPYEGPVDRSLIPNMNFGL